MSNIANFMAAEMATPEPKWRFRRIATFGTLIVANVLLATIIARTEDPGALQTLGLALIAQMILVHVIYLVAPTAEYIGRVAEVIRAVKA